MNTETLQALTTLANKLGVAAEVLWGALLKQAPITGAIDLMIILVMTSVLAFFITLVIKKTTKPPKGDGTGWPPEAEWRGEGAVFAWLGGLLYALTVLIVVATVLPNAIAAFVNPEFWALRQILK